MKKKDITKLHELSVAELQKKLEEMQRVLAKSRLEKKVGKLPNPRSVSMLSDDIARVKTIMRQKEME